MPDNSMEAWGFTLDGRETQTVSSGKSRKVIAKWEGSAVLLNSIIAEKTSSRVVMDRWKVSRDGTRLIIHREVQRPGGEIEGELVYQRK